LAWAFYLLQKNHRTYLHHRKLQVQFQQANKLEIEKRFTVPPEWFQDIEVSLGTSVAGLELLLLHRRSGRSIWYSWRMDQLSPNIGAIGTHPNYGEGNDALYGSP
jgi:hypothetical protein